MNNQHKTITPRVVVQMLFFVVVIPFLPLLISWRWDWWEAWVYAIICVLGFAISRALAARRHPDLLTERARFMRHENAASWDRLLAPLVGLGGGLIPLVAGLDALFDWSPTFSLPIKVVSLVLILAGYALGAYALIENRYFSGMVRIQADRGHQVVSSGPYRWVRHPGYAGALLTYLATPVFLDAPWALLPVVFLTIVLVIRTELEDRTLQGQLEGYRDYARRVRYRLLPGVWLVPLVLVLALSAGGLADAGAGPAPHSPAAAPSNAGPILLMNTEYEPATINLASRTVFLPPLQDITAIAAGGSHTCALTAGGGVKCWGDNRYGQLGDGTTTQNSAPVAVVRLGDGVTTIAAGGHHTCALTTGGGVQCWGANEDGQLGDGTTTQRSTPVDVVGLGSGVVAIAAGGYHTCALTTGGGIQCWGANWSGQLGDGTTTRRRTPVDVVGLESGAAAVATGWGHTCALTAGGGVQCWGANAVGQLGDGTTTERYTPVGVVGLDSDAAAISTSGSHTCALIAGGGVQCWGDNWHGQLGDGTTTQRSTPVDVVGLGGGAMAITAGGSHTCALIGGGGVQCWGANSVGQLGDGTTTERSTPVAVVGLASGVVAIAAGGSHTCALTTGGGVKCWGWNWHGQLGDGTAIRRRTPMDVVGLDSSAAAITAGGSHTCALIAGGGVQCWGANLFGQLGDGTTSGRSTPVDVVGLGGGPAAIAAGWDHTCALTAGGGVQCWGWNYYGQLGDGTTTQSSMPVDVVGLDSGAVAITAGDHHTCALTGGGGVQCWGDNEDGQLGDGTANQSSTPVDVVGLGSGATAIAAGGEHTCALTGGGGVQCWGDNRYGQLGDGTTTARSTPVAVVGLGSGAAAITAGSEHTCALTTGGGVQCWGDNRYGQLGDGTTTQHSTPVAVVGLDSGAAAITTRGSHTCALTTGGGVQCWGANEDAQLGDGTTTGRSTPVAVVGLASHTAAIAAGGSHTCALTTGGGVKCWGCDRSGQLGLGTITYRTIPVDVVLLPKVYLPFVFMSR